MNLESIGKYRDLERLGRGGMAEVFLGRDPHLDRRVAIKVILPHLVEEETFEERFRQEARLVASLRHPNIVKIYEYDFHGNQPFMVMEYFQGGTLKDIIAQYRAKGMTVPLGEIANLLDPIADALDFAHAHGMVHRDIKPSNILFSSDGEPVIVDFGIAKILDESLHLTVTGGLVGSPPYMSPEQAASKPVEKYCDIYSLGIVVYEMATGRVPFVGDSITGVLMQHLNDPPPPIRELNPNISKSLQDVMQIVLAKDPADRFPSAGAFARAFRKALSGDPPIQIFTETETPVTEKETLLDFPPPIQETRADDPSPILPETIQNIDQFIHKAERPLTGKDRRRWPIFMGVLAALILVIGILTVINPGGILPSIPVIGNQNDEGEVLLYTSLDNEEAITSPEVGLPGHFSLDPADFVPTDDGGGILFNRLGGCQAANFQEVSFPAWQGDEINVNLEDGELSFWYQPLYDATDADGFYPLVAISLDGDSHSSIYLDFNEGYFSLDLVDKDRNWIGTDASYRAPLWNRGDRVYIRAVWDSWNESDSLQLYVNDLRVDSGGVPGGWVMDAEEYAFRIFIGTSVTCGEFVANGIIDELTIRHFP